MHKYWKIVQRCSTLLTLPGLALVAGCGRGSAIDTWLGGADVCCEAVPVDCCALPPVLCCEAPEPSAGPASGEVPHVIAGTEENDVFLTPAAADPTTPDLTSAESHAEHSTL